MSYRKVGEVFEEHQGRLIDKWAHYLPLYERHFWPFVGRSIRVLEIGVGHGGSLQLWKAYFGPNAEIVGLDIDPRCKEYEEPQITIHIGNQANPPVMGRFDIVIDDGSHVLADQQASLTALWPALNQGGVYWIEDCHHGEGPEIPHENLGSACYYRWIRVFEKSVAGTQRIVKGRPSRPLNAAELAAYGAL